MKKLILLISLLYTYSLQAQVIFEDNFETGSFNQQWIQRPNLVGTNGVIDITSNTKFNGQYGAYIGKSSDGDFTTNALDLPLDLSGQSQVELSFAIYDFGDETQPEDGLYFSDGGDFVKVFDFLPEEWCNAWGQFPPFDIDKLAMANGLTLNSQFVIRFQQHDNADFSTTNDEDGFYIDDVIVQVPTTEYATLPFEDDFETGEFKKAWSWSHPDSTVLSSNEIKSTGWVGVSTGSPNSGTYAAFMGKRCDDGFTTNALDLHLNLAGQSQVELSFVLRDFGDETQPQDGLYFSNDGGLNFTKVYDFDPSTYGNSYQPYNINISELVENAGLPFSDSSIIRFQQHDDADFSTTNDEDGFYIDDVKVQNAKLPFISSFSPGIGPVDREITIVGQNFDSVSSVRIGEAEATFTIVDSATMIAVVPSAAETGKITVTNEEGDYMTDNMFIVSTDLVGIPIQLEATAYTCFTQLIWRDTATNETGFFVERSTPELEVFEKIATLNANSTSYVDGSIENGVDYEYRIRAFNTLGNSPYSNIANAVAIVGNDCGGTDNGEKPAAPTSFNATQSEAEETSIILTWDASENATSYEIYRILASGEPVLVGTTTETTFTDFGLAFGTAYTYYVQAVNGNQKSEPSQESTATTIDKVLSIGDDLADVSELLRIYPNPTEEHLQLTLKNNNYSEVQLRVINMVGQVQLLQNFSKKQTVIDKTIDTSNLRPGVYFVEIMQNGFRNVQRLAKE